MRVWRICRERYAADALSGRGGLVVSGRWHTRGRPVVYASESLALAALEVLVHADRATAPADLVRVEIDVPDGLSVARVSTRDLPKDWRKYPSHPDLRRRGDEWLRGGSTPVLEVPSVVVPEESNFLLNPQHPDARRLSIVSTRRFSLDARLLS